MRKFVTLLFTACLAAFGLHAQMKVIDIYPAHDTSLSRIKLNEAFMTRKYYPKTAFTRWSGGLLVVDNKVVIDPKTMREEPYKAPAKADVVTFPDKAQNKTIINDNLCVYTIENNIFAQTPTESYQITDNAPQVVSGQAVSRHEFGIDGGIFVSPDRRLVAFYTKDESAVADFPLLRTAGNGSLKSIKYPMAGCPSEKVSVGVHDTWTRNTIILKTECFDPEQYLTNLSFSPDGQKIYLMVLARDQRHMRLNEYDSFTGDFLRTILTEEDEKYVENCDPIDFIKGSSDKFLYVTNVRDGFRNIYLCSTDGSTERLTRLNADVEYIGNDGRRVYFNSHSVSPIESHLCFIDLKTRRQGSLTPQRGWHSVSFNEDMTYFVDRYSSLNEPGIVNLCEARTGRIIKNISTAEDPCLEYAMCEIELGEVPSADGAYMNAYRLIKPLGFDPSKKYPLIVYVYGGPHSNMLADSFRAKLRIWEMYMAQNGYMVYVQDNRGTSNHGEAYEKAIWKQCGVVEMEDQLKGLNALIDRGNVDVSRIGVMGWSYGGFMSLSLKTSYPSSVYFKVAVAGGPVIDWKWYEVMYGERYMTTPQENPEGYARTSLLNKTSSLIGIKDPHILILQGMNDDTVVPQHSLNFVQKCIDRNIRVNFFPYPTAPHNVMDPLNRVYLYEQISNYFFENL